MKNNKAFTFVEMFNVVIIVAIIGAIVLQFSDSFARLLFYVFMYFAIPATIFGVALKLNQKYKWVVKGKYDRYIANFIDGEYMDNEMVNIQLTAYFILWPIYIPCFIAWIGGKELYHRYIKTIIYNMSKKKGGFFSIPTFGDKE